METMDSFSLNCVTCGMDAVIRCGQKVPCLWNRMLRVYPQGALRNPRQPPLDIGATNQ